VRIRPPAGREHGCGSGCLHSTEAGLAAGGKSFTFPASVIQGSDQPVAHDALTTSLLIRLQEGYSCSLLAYGQTGSGKTHTMFGPPGSLTEVTLAETGGEAPAAWSVFPRTVLQLLKVPGLGKLHASAVEVYQD